MRRSTLEGTPSRPSRRSRKVNRRGGSAAAALLSLAALAAIRGGGGGGPPLYDGICLPPTYLLLGSHPGPSSVSKTYSVSDLASSQPLYTGESTPQAELIFGSGSFAPAPGASTVTVSITPVKPPATNPSDGRIDGNVYSFDAHSGGQEVSLAASHPATVVLGATSSGGPRLVVERFDGSRWTPVGKTFQSGCGTTYEAASPTLGLFALVAQGSSTSPGSTVQSPGTGSSPAVVIVILVVLAIVALVVGGVRVARRRR
jgi:hypothetical protein